MATKDEEKKWGEEEGREQERWKRRKAREEGGREGQEGEAGKQRPPPKRNPRI